MDEYKTQLNRSLESQRLHLQAAKKVCNDLDFQFTICDREKKIEGRHNQIETPKWPFFFLNQIAAKWPFFFLNRIAPAKRPFLFLKRN